AESNGGDGRRRHARAGQVARAVKATVAATVWATKFPRAGWAKAATITVAMPPPASTSRPVHRAGRRPRAVTTWHAPRPARADVMIQRSVAPWAARALMVSRTGL